MDGRTLEFVHLSVFSLINYRKYSCLNMYLDTELFPLLSPGNKSAGCIDDATQCF